MISFRHKLAIAAMVGALVITLLPQTVNATGQGDDKAEVEAMRKMATEISQKIAEMPQYTVFDWITYDIDDNIVTLSGTVIDTTVRTQAEQAAEKTDGVEGVHNDIKYVQRTKLDDRLRLTLYNAIYQTYLHDYTRYASYQYLGASTGAFPRGPHPIQILVDHGNVVLLGHVFSAADKATAGRAVKNVGGLVRTFVNGLVVVSKPKE